MRIINLSPTQKRAVLKPAARRHRPARPVIDIADRRPRVNPRDLFDVRTASQRGIRQMQPHAHPNLVRVMREYDAKNPHATALERDAYKYTRQRIMMGGGTARETIVHTLRHLPPAVEDLHASVGLPRERIVRSVPRLLGLDPTADTVARGVGEVLASLVNPIGDTGALVAGLIEDPRQTGAALAQEFDFRRLADPSVTQVEKTGMVANLLGLGLGAAGISMAARNAMRRRATPVLPGQGTAAEALVAATKPPELTPDIPVVPMPLRATPSVAKATMLELRPSPPITAMPEIASADRLAVMRQLAQRTPASQRAAMIRQMEEAGIQRVPDPVEELLPEPAVELLPGLPVQTARVARAKRPRKPAPAKQDVEAAVPETIPEPIITPEQRYAALKQMTPKERSAALKQMPSQERNRVIDQMTPQERRQMVETMLPAARVRKGLTVEEDELVDTALDLDPDDLTKLIPKMSPQVRSYVIKESDADTMVYMIDEFEPVDQIAILKLIEDPEARADAFDNLSLANQSEIRRLRSRKKEPPAVVTPEATEPSPMDLADKLLAMPLDKRAETIKQLPVQQIAQMLKENTRASLDELLLELPPSTRLRVVELLPPRRRDTIMTFVLPDDAVNIMNNLGSRDRLLNFELIPPKKQAEVFAKLSPEAQSDLFTVLPAAQQRKVLPKTLAERANFLAMMPESIQQQVLTYVLPANRPGLKELISKAKSERAPQATPDKLAVLMRQANDLQYMSAKEQLRVYNTVALGDWAERLERVSPELLPNIVERLPIEARADTIRALLPSFRAKVVEKLTPQKRVETLRKVPTLERTIIGDLSVDAAANTLERYPQTVRFDIINRNPGGERTAQIVSKLSPEVQADIFKRLSYTDRKRLEDAISNLTKAPTPDPAIAALVTPETPDVPAAVDAPVPNQADAPAAVPPVGTQDKNWIRSKLAGFKEENDARIKELEDIAQKKGRGMRNRREAGAVIRLDPDDIELFARKALSAAAESGLSIIDSLDTVLSGVGATLSASERKSVITRAETILAAQGVQPQELPNIVGGKPAPQHAAPVEGLTRADRASDKAWRHFMREGDAEVLGPPVAKAGFYVPGQAGRTAPILEEAWVYRTSGGDPVPDPNRFLTTTLPSVERTVRISGSKDFAGLSPEETVSITTAATQIQKALDDAHSKGKPTADLEELLYRVERIRAFSDSAHGRTLQMAGASVDLSTVTAAGITRLLRSQGHRIDSTHVKTAARIAQQYADIEKTLPESLRGLPPIQQSRVMMAVRSVHNKAIESYKAQQKTGAEAYRKKHLEEFARATAHLAANVPLDPATIQALGRLANALITPKLNLRQFWESMRDNPLFQKLEITEDDVLHAQLVTEYNAIPEAQLSTQGQAIGAPLGKVGRRSSRENLNKALVEAKVEADQAVEGISETMKELAKYMKYEDKFGEVVMPKLTMDHVVREVQDLRDASSELRQAAALLNTIQLWSPDTIKMPQKQFLLVDATRKLHRRLLTVTSLIERGASPSKLLRAAEQAIDEVSAAREVQAASDRGFVLSPLIEKITGIEGALAKVTDVAMARLKDSESIVAHVGKITHTEKHIGMRPKPQEPSKDSPELQGMKDLYAERRSLSRDLRGIKTTMGILQGKDRPAKLTKVPRQETYEMKRVGRLFARLEQRLDKGYDNSSVLSDRVKSIFTDLTQSVRAIRQTNWDQSHVDQFTTKLQAIAKDLEDEIQQADLRQEQFLLANQPTETALLESARQAVELQHKIAMLRSALPHLEEGADGRIRAISKSPWPAATRKRQFVSQEIKDLRRRASQLVATSRAVETSGNYMNAIKMLKGEITGDLAIFNDLLGKKRPERIPELIRAADQRTRLRRQLQYMMQDDGDVLYSDKVKYFIRTSRLANLFARARDFTGNIYNANELYTLRRPIERHVFHRMLFPGQRSFAPTDGRVLASIREGAIIRLRERLDEQMTVGDVDYITRYAGDAHYTPKNPWLARIGQTVQRITGVSDILTRDVMTRTLRMDVSYDYAWRKVHQREAGRISKLSAADIEKMVDQEQLRVLAGMDELEDPMYQDLRDLVNDIVLTEHFANTNMVTELLTALEGSLRNMARDGIAKMRDLKEGGYTAGIGQAAGAQAALVVLDVAIPFARVISNLSLRAMDYSFGLPHAAVRYGIARYRDARERLPLEGPLGVFKTEIPMRERRKILDLASRGMVGVAGFTLGKYLAESGAFPIAKDPDAHFPLPPWWVALLPVFSTVYAGAYYETLRVNYPGKHMGLDEVAFQRFWKMWHEIAAEASWQSGGFNIMQALSDPQKHYDKIPSSAVRSLIPGQIREHARESDIAAHVGSPMYGWQGLVDERRMDYQMPKPRGFVERVQTGIPTFTLPGGRKIGIGAVEERRKLPDIYRTR